MGLSNYSVEQVARYFEICNREGFVRPSVYQGHYNALIRRHEETLMPLLRKHGVAYYAFRPLSGGILTGKVTFATETLTRTRFAGESTQQYFLNTFDKPEIHDKLRTLSETCQQFGVSLSEVCLRWLVYHSALGGDDAITLGAKRLDQLEANVGDCRKGPLSQDLLKAVESMSSGGLVL
ncbi:hypothetical protein HYFRA_00012742 [Hymenoscyphus fraxineus]|uniref:NADP-dependent oxidoreductase domain-containing protein n=1 Tax=Hymenoscyphus fraxineus TaxID=746836 RepID=A0A9N9L688_9HELO|nr:hypothetical protein HYFRA_00012742 [Hymenoscyphus fraxineus]